MTWDWRDFLELSKELTGQDSKTIKDEARFRTAASRAYYASFHVCKSLATAKFCYPKESKGEDSHQKLIDWLGKQSDRRVQKISEKLDRMKNTRVSADYHLHFPNIADTTISHIQSGIEIISTIDSALMPVLNVMSAKK